MIARHSRNESHTAKLAWGIIRDRPMHETAVQGRAAQRQQLLADLGRHEQVPAMTDRQPIVPVDQPALR